MLARRVLTLAAVAGCAIGQNIFITTLPCFDETRYPTPCTFALAAAESNKGAQGFALGGIGGGFGTQFGEGSFGGVVVTTTTTTATLPVEDAADPAEGEASGAGETIVEPEQPTEPVNQCLSLIPFEDPEARLACAQFIYKKSGPCCTCVNPQAITVGEKIQFSAESNCTSEQVQEDIKEDIKFQGNVSGTAGVCLEQCCTTAESPTALVFEVSVDVSGQTESETRTVCTEMKNTDCACAPASLDNPGVDVVPPCEDNTVVTILIVVFSVIVFIVLALAVYFIIKRDEDGDSDSPPQKPYG